MDKRYNRVKDYKAALFGFNKIATIMVAIYGATLLMIMPLLIIVELPLICIALCLTSTLSFYIYHHAVLHYSIIPLSDEITTSAQGYNCLEVVTCEIPGQPLKTPYADTHCVWFDYVLLQRSHSSTRRVETKISHAPILAKDDFDEIIIDIDDANLYNLSYQEYQFKSPKNNQTKHKDHSESFKGDPLRFLYGYIATERWIPTGWKSTVYGYLQTYTYPQLLRLIIARKDRDAWKPMLKYLKSKYKENNSHQIHLMSKHQQLSWRLDFFLGGYHGQLYDDAKSKRNVSLLLAIIHGGVGFIGLIFLIQNTL